MCNTYGLFISIPLFGNTRNLNEKINKLIIIPYHMILSNFYFIFLFIRKI